MTIRQSLGATLASILKNLGISVGQKWVKRLGTPSEFTVKIDKFKSFKIRGTNLNLENKLFWKGFESGHEPATAKVFSDYAKNAKWVIDVGANSGFFSLVAKSTNSEVQVAAFEPHPFFHKLIEENARLNQYQITAINKAASDKAGTIVFFYANPNEGNVYSGTVNPSHFKNHQTTEPNSIEIETITLDECVASFGWTDGGLVKIDAEGHDEEVLHGFYRTIEKFQPVLIVEVQSESKAASIASLKFLEPYQYFGIHDKKGTITEALPIPHSPGCDNYLFLPKS